MIIKGGGGYCCIVVLIVIIKGGGGGWGGIRLWGWKEGFSLPFSTVNLCLECMITPRGSVRF